MADAAVRRHRGKCDDFTELPDCGYSGSRGAWNFACGSYYRVHGKLVPTNTWLSQAARPLCGHRSAFFLVWHHDLPGIRYQHFARRWPHPGHVSTLDGLVGRLLVDRLSDHDGRAAGGAPPTRKIRRNALAKRRRDSRWTAKNLAKCVLNWGV